MALAFGLAGRRADAQRILSGLESRSTKTFVTGEAIAAAALAVGDTDRALTLLERAARDHSFYIVFLGVDQAWDALRDHPRFLALIRQVGVVQWRLGAGRAAP